MAALDPTAPPKPNWNGEIPPKPRATLKIIRVENDMDDEEEDSDDEDEQLRYLMQGSDSDEEEDSDDEPNGGPSDKSKAKSKTKSKKEIKAEQLAELIKSVNEENDEDDDENEDEEMVDAKPNGTKSKGKEKATSDDEEEEEEDDDDDDDDDSDDMPEAEEYVLCTLDTENVGSDTLSQVSGFDANCSCRSINSLSTSPSARMSLFSSRSRVIMTFISLATTSWRMTKTPMMRAMTLILTRRSCFSATATKKMTRSATVRAMSSMT
jgi:hypothetical protein